MHYQRRYNINKEDCSEATSIGAVWAHLLTRCYFTAGEGYDVFPFQASLRNALGLQDMNLCEQYLHISQDYNFDLPEPQLKAVVKQICLIYCARGETDIKKLQKEQERHLCRTTEFTSNMMKVNGGYMWGIVSSGLSTQYRYAGNHVLQTNELADEETGEPFGILNLLKSEDVGKVHRALVLIKKRSAEYGE
jgi:hypothetical protein